MMMAPAAARTRPVADTVRSCTCCDHWHREVVRVRSEEASCVMGTGCKLRLSPIERAIVNMSR